MTVLVRGLSDERRVEQSHALYRMRQLYSIRVILYVDVYVEVAADQYWALIDRQLIKDFRQLANNHRQCLTVGSVEAEQDEVTACRRCGSTEKLECRRRRVEVLLLQPDRLSTYERQAAVVTETQRVDVGARW